MHTVYCAESGLARLGHWFGNRATPLVVVSPTSRTSVIGLSDRLSDQLACIIDKMYVKRARVSPEASKGKAFEEFGEPVTWRASCNAHAT